MKSSSPAAPARALALALLLCGFWVANIPVASAAPTCQNADSDPDGDGWGWENHQSCRMPDNPPPDNKDKDKDKDKDKKKKNPYCSSAKADPDGDGWGWENHRSCIVKDDDDKDDDDGDDGDGDGDGDGDDKDKDGDDKRKVDGVIFKQDFNDVDTGLYQGDQLNDGWQSPLWHIGFDQGNVKIVNSGTARAKAMEVTYAAGAFGAASGTAFLSSVQFTMGLPKSYDELYLSYDIYFDDDFTFVKGGKLPGLCGSDVNAAPSTGCNTGGGFPSGYDGWSARTMWRQNGAMENYVYHAGQENYYGDDELWNVDAERGKWHTIEHRVVLNSPGQKNGILEAWFDGKKVLGGNDYLFRKTASVGINLFYFSSFFGGNDASWAPAKDQTILFDNFVLSTKPIN